MAQVVLDALPVEYQKFKEVIVSLARLLMQRRLFPPAYPSVQKALSEAFMRLDVFIQYKKLVTLRISKGSIFHLNFEMDITTGNNREIHLFRETLGKLSIGEIEFSKGITKEELAAFIDILESASRNDKSIDLNEAWSKIYHIGIRHGMQYESSASSEPETIEKTAPVSTDNEQLAESKQKSDLGHIISEILHDLTKIQTGEGEKAGSRILNLIERGDKHTPVILLLESLKHYDDYTFTHSVNVAVITTAIARHIGFSEEKIDSIGIAALLHDIGKLYVPREIIHKTKRLTPSEWLLVKKHPIDGERILREEGVDVLSRRVAYEHHMRYDMRGYPKPKSGHQMHTASHIVRIADSYDALTTKRPYRKQMGPYGAIRMMFKYRGGEFHPGILDVFYSLLGNVPIGSVLKLSTGETALVIDINKTPEGLPLVRILTDAAGKPIGREIILDLNEKTPDGKTYVREITEIIDQQTRDVDVGSYVFKP